MTPSPNVNGLQAAVFAFLQDPATHGGEPVARFDTHAAAVFLAGDRAFKVKRAVAFPFLDYSTLDKRKAACLAELEVNRRFAPELYRRVAPITREADEGLAIGGQGDVVEWAVEMRRFDENRTLDRIADRGPLGDRMCDLLAAMVVAMHDRAERVEAEPWIEAIGLYIGQNTDVFRAHPTLFPGTATEALDAGSRDSLERLRPLLIARGRQGLVRRGHGDLHLANIAALGEEPVAFDAIEFDPLVASGDVLYDLGFLLMDLIERSDASAAAAILNGYMSAASSPEAYDGLAALPFFMSLRAAIRAKVIAARLDQGETPDAGSRRAARLYFDLALHLSAPAAPSVVCVGGLSGTGKSVLARRLAACVPPPPGALVLRSDVLRKRMLGVAEKAHAPAGAYRAEVSARVYADIVARMQRILRARHSVIVDAAFADAQTREQAENAARRAGAAFGGVFLTADLATRLARVESRGPDASDADAGVALAQEARDPGAMTWTKIDAGGSPAQTLDRVRAALAGEGLGEGLRSLRDGERQAVDRH